MRLHITKALKIVSSGYADRYVTSDTVAQVRDDSIDFAVPGHQALAALVRLGMEPSEAAALVAVTPIRTVLPYSTPRVSGSVTTSAARIAAGLKVAMGKALVGMTDAAFAEAEHVARGLTTEEWDAIEAGMVAVNVRHRHAREVIQPANQPAFASRHADVAPQRPEWAGAAPTPVPLDAKLHRSAPMEERVKQWLDWGGLSPAQEDVLAYIAGGASEEEARAALSGMHLPELTTLESVAEGIAQCGPADPRQARAGTVLNLIDRQLATLDVD